MAGRSPWEPGYTPNVAYRWLDAFTRAGINFWPVIWLDGESQQAKGPKLSWKYAAEMAQYLGGQASVCDTDLGACLYSLLDKSSHGWIVRIAGPEVDWPVRYTAQLLHLWYQPDRGVLDLKRPFVRLEKPRIRSARILAWRTVAPSVPLFDSVWLTGKAGCDASPGSEAKKYVDLPPTSQTTGSYRVIVFNPKAGWAGVGVVPIQEVIRNRN